MLLPNNHAKLAGGNRFIIALINSTHKKFEVVVDGLNNLSEEHHIKIKFLTLFDIISVSSKTQAVIKKLIAEDKIKKD